MSVHNEVSSLSPSQARANEATEVHVGKEWDEVLEDEESNGLKNGLERMDLMDLRMDLMDLRTSSFTGARPSDASAMSTFCLASLVKGQGHSQRRQLTANWSASADFREISVMRDMVFINTDAFCGPLTARLVVIMKRRLLPDCLSWSPAK